jgi:hypothetical protein
MSIFGIPGTVHAAYYRDVSIFNAATLS